MSEHRTEHRVTTEDLAGEHRADEIPEQQERQPDDSWDRPQAETWDRQDTVAEAEAEPETEPEPVTETPVAQQTETPQTETPQRDHLFENDDVDRFRENWRGLQSDFVDDPRAAVQQADELVAEVMQTLASTFAEHKRTLEEQWSRGDEVQTEDLRIALQQYRTFFHQLLAI